MLTYTFLYQNKSDEINLKLKYMTIAYDINFNEKS